MQREKIIEEINNLIRQSDQVLSTEDTDDYGYLYVDYEIFNTWYTKIKTLLSAILPSDNEFRCKINDYCHNLPNNVDSIVSILKSIIEYEEKEIITFQDAAIANKKNNIDILFKNFHKVVRQLRDRHDDRSTLDVEDEYDVQDLLHGMLMFFYDDIRPEEWTPSYAGKASRQDFLIKKEQFVIETKMTRKSLTDKELGDELIIDIARYKTHPDCKQLIVFIYDPEGRVKNPNGFISDIEHTNKGFVKVYINPK